MTKQVKLVITAVVFIFLVYLGYNVYQTTNEGIGSFDKFDINSTAGKTITVELVHEKGFTPNPDGGVVFFVKDINSTEKKVVLGRELPTEINNAKIITISGHLHGDYFHATDAELD